MSTCFRGILECLQGPSYSVAPSYAYLQDLPCVKLDTTQIGSDVVIVKNGHRICGTGAALGNAPVVQNKAYFEVKIQQTGLWGIGLSSKGIDLNHLPLAQDLDSLCWVLRQDGAVYNCGESLAQMDPAPEEGDVIGVAFDHIDLKFYKNGQPTNCSVSGIRGTVYPVLYVDEGAILDVQFTAFWNDPPSGYEEIMLEQTIL